MNAAQAGLGDYQVPPEEGWAYTVSIGRISSSRVSCALREFMNSVKRRGVGCGRIALI